MEIASRCLRTFTLSHHAAPRKLPCLGLGYGYGYAAPCARPRCHLVLASPYEGEDDDFVVICTNRAVLDLTSGYLDLVQRLEFGVDNLQKNAVYQIE